MSNEVDSKTRRYFGKSEGYDECCPKNEHKTIKDAFYCLVNKGVDHLWIGVGAIDWAFGERAVVPTFGKEWQEIVKIRDAINESRET